MDERSLALLFPLADGIARGTHGTHTHMQLQTQSSPLIRRPFALRPRVNSASGLIYESIRATGRGASQYPRPPIHIELTTRPRRCDPDLIRRLNIYVQMRDLFEVKTILDWMGNYYQHDLPVSTRESIHVASFFGFSHIVSYLVSIEAEDVNAPLRPRENPEDASFERFVMSNQQSSLASEQHVIRPLDLAASGGHIECCRMLLDLGADIRATSVGGKSALHWAAAHENPEMLDFLISRGALVHSTDYHGREPLHYAAHLGHLQNISRLIGHDAKVDVPDNARRTPLYYAIENGRSGNMSTCEKLITHGASIAWKDVDGYTPLHVAACSGVAEITRLLLRAGAPTDDLTKDGKSALVLSLESGYHQVFRLLGESGASLAWKGEMDRQLLHIAAALERSWAVRLLIMWKADLHSKDHWNATPLHFAAISSRDCAQILLANGANIRARDSQGRMPIHLASSAGRLEIVSLLLDVDPAVVDEMDDSYCTPLDIAHQHNRSDVFNYLRGFNARFGKDIVTLAVHKISVFYSFYKNHPDRPRGKRSSPCWTDALDSRQPIFRKQSYLLTKSPKFRPLQNRYVTLPQPLPQAPPPPQDGPVEITTETEIFAPKLEEYRPFLKQDELDQLAKLGRSWRKRILRIVAYLRTLASQCGEFVDNKSPVLHIAAYYGLTDLCLELIKNGTGQIHEVDTRGLRVIDVAARAGHTSTCFELMRQGADPIIPDSEGRTAYHWAIMGGHADTLQLLIKDRGICSHKTSRGLEPIHLACSLGYTECVKILVRIGGKSINTPAADGRRGLHFTIEGGTESLHALQTILGVEWNGSKRAKIDGGLLVDEEDENGQTALHYAIKKNCYEAAHLLLLAGAKPNVMDKAGHSPLSLGIKRGISLRLFEEAIKSREHLAWKDNLGRSYSHAAAIEGRVDILQTIARLHGNLSDIDWEGRTPLHLAMLHMQLECCEELLRHGVNPDRLDFKGQTPLHICCSIDYIAGVKFLLDTAKASMNICDFKTKTPLDVATACGSAHVLSELHARDALDGNAVESDRISQIKKRKKRDARKRFENAAMIIHRMLTVNRIWQSFKATRIVGKEFLNRIDVAYKSRNLEAMQKVIDGYRDVDLSEHGKAVQFTLPKACVLGLRTNILQFLYDERIASGMDIQPEIDHCLRLGCYTDHIRIIRWALDRGASPASRDEFDRDSMDYGVRAKSLYALMLLMKRGVNPLEKDRNGSSNFLKAVALGHEEIIQHFLQDHSRNYISETDHDGMNALHHAAANGHSNLGLYFIKYGWPIDGTSLRHDTALHVAVRWNQISFVEMLLRNQADVGLSNIFGMLPVMSAAMHGHSDIFKLLLQKHPTLGQCNSDGFYVSHLAAGNGQASILRILKEEPYRSLMLIKDAQGASVLHHAASASCECVEIVLSYDSNINARDRLGETPLHKAVIAGRLDVVIIFVKHHASVNTVNIHNRSPLDDANSGQNLRLMEFLLEYGSATGARILDEYASRIQRWYRKCLLTRMAGSNLEDEIEHILSLPPRSLLLPSSLADEDSSQLRLLELESAALTIQAWWKSLHASKSSGRKCNISLRTSISPVNTKENEGLHPINRAPLDSSPRTPIRYRTSPSQSPQALTGQSLVDVDLSVGLEPYSPTLVTEKHHTPLSQADHQVTPHLQESFVRNTVDGLRSGIHRTHSVDQTVYEPT
eukprot:TRINITY_DN1692_c0_g1_i1.p1 TRINITY_DN1692_c0_g1~~TRINITY_DN1692_c0_g1_i1.p1  ORF type:complete len:1685 (-),score=327.32 TRINITY_DN1692_c0_g1_i1:603-5657(-)